MTEKGIFGSEVLTKVCNKIEKECGFTNAAFLVSFILLFMDTESWTLDKSYLAKVYQAIDIIEKDEELKQLFTAKPTDEVAAAPPSDDLTNNEN